MSKVETPTSSLTSDEAIGVVVNGSSVHCDDDESTQQQQQQQCLPSVTTFSNDNNIPLEQLSNDIHENNMNDDLLVDNDDSFGDFNAANSSAMMDDEVICETNTEQILSDEDTLKNGIDIQNNTTLIDEKENNDDKVEVTDHDAPINLLEDIGSTKMSEMNENTTTVTNADLLSDHHNNNTISLLSQEIISPIESITDVNDGFSTDRHEVLPISTSNQNDNDTIFETTTPAVSDTTVEMTEETEKDIIDDVNNHQDAGDNFDFITIQQPPLSSDNNKINIDHNDSVDDFGDFDTAEPIALDAVHNDIPVDDNNNDTDFGDFDTAEASPSLHVEDTHANDDNHDKVAIADDDDDDDFGDFDEAPVSINTTTTTTTTEINAEHVVGTTPSNNFIQGDHVVDPVLYKIKSAFSKIFSRYADESKLNGDIVDNLDSIPCFEENEMISISSVLENFKKDASASERRQPRDSTQLLKTLLFRESNETDHDSTPSRYIKSKNTTLPSPTRYPIRGRLFVDNEYRMTKKTDGGDQSSDTTSTLNTLGGLPRMKEGDMVPSDQAKAILDRIPDLSYMLSSTLSVTNTNIVNK